MKNASQTIRTQPEYFEVVRQQARRRWEQLEADPDLAGPWKQLFSQIQSPRHVLSELLQNADDAGATAAVARVEDDTFTFEHDGVDFTSDEFTSLCRFGFSNKRNLHTIGFRGIGFKSTFSLGDAVDVLTPTLAIRFERRRFTEPVWIAEAPPESLTTVRVPIKDSRRRRELQKNLDDWAESPASLLFFNNIRQLTIGNVTVRKEIMGAGPVADSQWVELIGAETHKVLVARSQEEEFPAEAVEEIRAERIAEDITLPPCRVELVLGLPGDQRVYVVLPTDMHLEVPFSCNAPFVQDPARTGIKDPAISATNRWLLERLGALAAQTMLAWIRKRDFTMEERASAYSLLPAAPVKDDVHGASDIIVARFAEKTDAAPVILTERKTVVKPDACFAPPHALYTVWSEDQLRGILGETDKFMLSAEVLGKHCQALSNWRWLQPISDDTVIERLSSGLPPKPESWESLLALWEFVARVIKHDYDGEKRKKVRIVPVEGSDVLHAANDAVRLPAEGNAFQPDDWHFLSRFVPVLDSGWSAFLSEMQQAGETGASAKQRQKVQQALELLKAIALDRADSRENIMSLASSAFFAREDVPDEEALRLTRIFAALDVAVPEDFMYICRDGCLHRVSEGLLHGLNVAIETVLPDEWVCNHLLNESYLSAAHAGGAPLRDWLSSAKSGCRFFPQLARRNNRIWGTSRLEGLIEERSGTKPNGYRLTSSNFSIEDFDFEPPLVSHWEQLAKTDDKVYMRLLTAVLKAPSEQWRTSLQAKVKQDGYRYSYDVWCGAPVAAWVARLRGVPCLPDTYGAARVPAELLRRAPDTEPLMGVEPFVAADYDTESNHPLMDVLGVRSTPAGPEKLIERIRGLAAAENAPIVEVAKWYDALDRVLARSRPDDLEQARQAFRTDRLILTSIDEWASAAEVFLSADEYEMPDVPLIHPSLVALSMWKRLGVAERPTADLVIGRLKEMQNGATLNAQDIRRLRVCLKRYSLRVWQECGHWLTLNNTWSPVDDLAFCLHADTGDHVGQLFPAIRARTADLRMLPVEYASDSPFSATRNLGASLEFRLADAQSPFLAPSQPEVPWLAALGNVLKRVRLTDLEDTARVRAVADRLAKTVWHACNAIHVAPYLDGAPAGPTFSPRVLWHGETLHVQQGRMAALMKEIVAELARPFGLMEITEAIRYCADRSESFIEEYFTENFDLEDTVPASPPEEPPAAEEAPSAEAEPPEKEEEATEETGIAEDETTETPTEEEDQKEKERERRPTHREPSLMESYARLKGFHWDAGRSLYVHADGRTLRRCIGTFQWESYSATGDFLCNYWVSDQCLATSGVELGAEVWETVRRAPGESCLILRAASGQPHELPGTELTSLVEGKVVTLYPAKYRLRGAT